MHVDDLLSEMFPTVGRSSRGNYKSGFADRIFKNTSYLYFCIIKENNSDFQG